jgi:hypothetical protein
MSRIEFSSTQFQPYLPESCQVNPGVYGFELACWLSRALADAGFATSYPCNEDWGWYIEYVEGEAAYLIGCGCEAAEGDGYRGVPVNWHVFVVQNVSFSQCLTGVEVPDLDGTLTEAVLAALRSAGIEARVVEDRAA